LVSDIPAVDGKIANLFLQCMRNEGGRKGAGKGLELEEREKEAEGGESRE
jgi:hypothetical protein